jgi:hypothetical protein
MNAGKIGKNYTSWTDNSLILFAKYRQNHRQNVSPPMI